MPELMIFALHRNDSHVSASGITRRVLTSGSDLERVACATLASAEPERTAPALLVGALGFDGDALLIQPRMVTRDAPGNPFASTMQSASVTSVEPVPSPSRYVASVQDALGEIAAGRIGKVVLARSLVVRTEAPVDPVALAGRLSVDPTITTFLLDLSDGTPRHLVGATPELLVARNGLEVRSRPLAGSAARSPDGARDRAAATALLRSDKDRREHRLVVEAILDILAPHCRRLAAPDEPALHRTATMWHLGTSITGELRPGAPSVAGLAALLHPTPAVGGHPRAPALELIRRLEPAARGFYGGAVGWVDAAGDGEWHLALRCAEIAGTRLTLHAGAGIVAGSDPEAELAETGAKFRAMLRALDLSDMAGSAGLEGRREAAGRVA